jgi:co-chaperonin GroES (HSP10)
VVKREAEERKSAGGVVIPDTASEKPTFGKVIAVGKGKILENGETRTLDVRVGDRCSANAAARRSRSTIRRWSSCARTT